MKEELKEVEEENIFEAGGSHPSHGIYDFIRLISRVSGSDDIIGALFRECFRPLKARFYGINPRDVRSSSFCIQAIKALSPTSGGVLLYRSHEWWCHLALAHRSWWSSPLCALDGVSGALR